MRDLSRNFVPVSFSRLETGSTVTDDELMVRGARGDEEALQLLVERWEKPVFAFLERMVGSREEAQDLGQETFLRVCRHAARYKPSGKFKSWLFRIAGNLARSRLRYRKVLQWVRYVPGLHDPLSAEAVADERLQNEHVRESVRAVLAKLPVRQREAIVLRQYEGWSYQEIADTMQITVSAVESLLHRGMAKMRKDLIKKKVL
jgi:RNA polymerase sigma-70 factor (ECF subfamily)